MAKEEIPDDTLAETFIADFPICTRARNALIDAGYGTLDLLKGLFLEELKAIPGLGKTGLIELRDYVGMKYKIFFKNKPKPKAVDNSKFKRAQEVVEHFLGKDLPDWGKQIRNAYQLLQKYSFETLLSVKPSPKVYSLAWYVLYGHEYISKYIPVTIVTKEEEKEEEEIEKVDFVPQINNKPKNLKDFLNV